MPTDHKFRAQSAEMFQSGETVLHGTFLLNGNVDAVGIVVIASSGSPGDQQGVYSGDFEKPRVRLGCNPVGLDKLLEILRAANIVEVRFTTVADLLPSGPGVAFNSFDISARRNYE